jgi:hypothetical protein
MTFNQPFSAGNPLTVAKKIVEGDYDPLSEEIYSPLLINCVRGCMTAIPKQRPDILQLSAMMSQVLMR